jgi:hypothetical protein
MSRLVIRSNAPRRLGSASPWSGRSPFRLYNAQAEQGQRAIMWRLSTLAHRERTVGANKKEPVVRHLLWNEWFLLTMASNYVNITLVHQVLCSDHRIPRILKHEGRVHGLVVTRRDVRGGLVLQARHAVPQRGERVPQYTIAVRRHPLHNMGWRERRASVECLACTQPPHPTHKHKPSLL